MDRSKYTKLEIEAMEYITNLDVNSASTDELEKMNKLADLLLNEDSVPKRKYREALGLPRPVTRKAELKTFKQIRKNINANNGFNVITKSGKLPRGNSKNGYSEPPPGGERIRFVLQAAAQAIRSGVPREKSTKRRPNLLTGLV